MNQNLAQYNPKALRSAWLQHLLSLSGIFGDRLIISLRVGPGLCHLSGTPCWHRFRNCCTSRFHSSGLFRSSDEAPPQIKSYYCFFVFYFLLASSIARCQLARLASGRVLARKPCNNDSTTMSDSADVIMHHCFLFLLFVSVGFYFLCPLLFFIVFFCCFAMHHDIVSSNFKVPQQGLMRCLGLKANLSGSQ